MKKYIFKTSVLLATINFIVACTKKDDCPYVIEEKVVVVPPVPVTGGPNPRPDCQLSPFNGYMISTQAPTATSGSVGVISDARITSTAPLGQDWNDPILLGSARIKSFAPAMWTKSAIGQVFGIALDDNKGIFLSASDIYNATYAYLNAATVQQFGPAGPAGIYYTAMTNINTTTQLVTSVNTASLNTVGTATIPNSGIGAGNSLGNIAYDSKNQQLFATNLEDGRIYRINPSTGIVLSIFDPFALDNAVKGVAPVMEVLWGIGVYTDSANVTSVYFSRTTADSALSQSSGGAGSKDIWSIKLNGAGEFLATEVGSTKLFVDTASSSQAEIINVAGTLAKVTDIAFSKSGKMLLAERGAAHQSQVFEYVKTGTWGLSSRNFYIGGQTTGVTGGQNATGGVDYSSRDNGNNFICDDIVWATGNFLLPKIKPSNALYVYSVQGISANGNRTGTYFPNTFGTGGSLAQTTLPEYSATDIYIHTNITVPANKNGVGDVEVFRCKCCN